MHKIVTGLVFAIWGFAATAETPTIAALGDSLVQGYGLVPEDGFVSQLQAWLRANGTDVVLINAGVSGDTSAGGAARAAWTLTPEVDALIVVLGGNDILRGLDPAVTRANIDRILQSAQQVDVDVLLVGMKAPGNYGPQYQADFDAIYPELAQQYGTVFFDSFFHGLTGEGSDPAALGAYMQADGIHPNAQGVALIVDEMGPAVLELLARTATDG